MRGGGKVARWRRKTHDVRALERGGELESVGKTCGGGRGSSRVYIGGRGSTWDG
jgi:hypothetical protein